MLPPSALIIYLKTFQEQGQPVAGAHVQMRPMHFRMSYAAPCVSKISNGTFDGWLFCLLLGKLRSM